MDQYSTIHFNSCNFNDGANSFLMAGDNLFNTGTVGDLCSMRDCVLTKENNGDDFNIHGGDGKLNNNEPNRVGIALPARDIGNLSNPISNELNSSCTLHLNECALDYVPVNPTVEEVIAFGGIPKPSPGMRSSSRLGHQRDGDMPQLDRAMKMAHMRDDAPNTGKLTIPKFSIVNIPDADFIQRAGSLGVSLGNNEMEVIRSIKGIKSLEEKRILTVLQKNVDDILNKDEGPSTLVMSKVSTLCEDLIEDESIPFDLDDQLEHLKPVIKEKKLGKGKLMT
jgi:hypothetical protein